MKTVLDYQSLSAAISAHFRPGVDTNCTLKADALRQEVEAGTLLMHQWQGGLLLLRRRPGRHILNFYRTDRTVPLDIALPPDTVVELPMRPGQTGTAEWWLAQGFRLVENRVRLTRPVLKTGQSMPPEAPLPVSAEGVLALLKGCFDPLTGCLPTLEELEGDLRKNLLITAGDNGILRYNDGRIAEIRHLAVAEDVRGCGVGSALLTRFNSRTADRTARVWTGKDNAAAHRVYEKAGFAPDGWQSAVLTAPETIIAMTNK